MIQHTGERRFPCGLCGRKFTRKESLIKHKNCPPVEQSADPSLALHHGTEQTIKSPLSQVHIIEQSTDTMLPSIPSLECVKSEPENTDVSIKEEKIDECFVEDSLVIFSS